MPQVIHPPCDFPEIWIGLAAPFDKEDVRERKGAGGKMLSYITARTAMNRFDEVVGPENWDDTYKETRDGLMCSITVTLPDGRKVTKTDGGGFADMPEEDNVEKSAYSDAFKRAAVKFGVARYLYQNGVPRWIRAVVMDGATLGPRRVGLAPEPAPAQPAPEPAPQPEPRPAKAAPKAETRSFEDYTADAARVCVGKRTADLIEYLYEAAVDQGRVPAALRDYEGKKEELRHLWVREKPWVMTSTKAFVLLHGPRTKATTAA